MTRNELEEKLNYNFKFAKIKYKNECGIAFQIGETISKTWQSNDSIIFWEDGEHTVIPEEFEFLGYVF